MALVGMWLVVLGLAIVILILVILRRTSKFNSDSKIPKIIWTYWQTEDIPDLVQRCIDTWRKHNKDYDIRVLNRNSIKNWATDLDVTLLKMNDGPARESDIVRLNILSKYGGVWADASIRMNRSMDYILDIQREKGCELVGYYLESFTSKIEYPVIESWFFACIPNSKFVRDWRDEFMSIEKHKSVGDYVHNKKTQGVDLQTLKWIEYLAIHVSAQTVMQKMPPQEVSEKLHLMKAEDGPLNHVPKNDDDLPEKLKNICEYGSASPFIKLRHTDRNVIRDNKHLDCIYK
jgi:hypothetical protein